MHWYHEVVIFAGVAALLLSLKTPRAWWWVVAILLAYLIPAGYSNIPRYDVNEWWLPVAAVSCLCDLVVVATIREFRKELWEKALSSIVLLSGSIGLLQAAGVIVGHPPPVSTYWFGTAMEVLNIACFALIGGRGIVDWASDGNKNHGSDRSRNFMAKLDHMANKPARSSQTLRKW